MRVNRQQLALAYGDAHLARARHQIVYTDLGRCHPYLESVAYGD